MLLEGWKFHLYPLTSREENDAKDWSQASVISDFFFYFLFF